MKQKRVVLPLLLITFSISLCCSSYCSVIEQSHDYLLSDTSSSDQSAGISAYITDNALAACQLLKDDLSKLDSVACRNLYAVIESNSRLVDYASALSFLYDVLETDKSKQEDTHEDTHAKAYQDLVLYLEELENGEHVVVQDSDSSSEITKGIVRACRRSSGLCNLSVRNCLKTKNLLVTGNEVVKGSLTANKLQVGDITISGKISFPDTANITTGTLTATNKISTPLLQARDIQARTLHLTPNDPTRNLEPLLLEVEGGARIRDLEVQNTLTVLGVLNAPLLNVDTIQAPNISTTGNISAPQGTIEALNVNVLQTLTAQDAVLGQTQVSSLTNTGPTVLNSLSSGVVHADATGLLSSALITNNDIEDNSIGDNKLVSTVTSAALPDTIVRRDASGNFSAGTITADLIGNATTATTATTAINCINCPGASGTPDNVPNTLVQRDANGDFAAGVITADLIGNATTATTATTAVTATDFTGALAGDVTGTQSATVVETVGGQTAAAIANATTLANTGTSANTADTLVRRDAAGNFSAGTITADLIGNATTATTATTAINCINCPGTSGTPDNVPNTLVQRDANGDFAAGVITADLLGNATTATTATTAVMATDFIGSLAGDVTGTQTNTVVEFVDGQTAAAIANATILANAATSANTVDTLVLRDASGNFAANIITADLVGNATTATTSTNFSGSLAGNVTGTQTNTVVETVGGQTAPDIANATILANAATSANTVDTLVLRDASGNFAAGTITADLVGNATTATTATNFSGSLAGDVTGTQSTTVVETVGGQTAADIANATTLANAATSANTVDMLVRRDASGNFAANIITADLVGNATAATTSTNFSGSLAGNVTGTQSTTVVETVGGQTAANIASGASLANAATSSNTANTIVRRNASGGFTAGTITGTLIGNASTATTATTVIGQTSNNIPSRVVVRDASGNFAAGTITADLVGNATTATAATNFSGSLAGDVTGTQSTTVVETVGGQTAADIANATTLANTATSANTVNMLVRRDASGNFAAGVITADLIGNATSATSSTNFAGALSGDVTGTQSTTVVETVGGQTAANIASATSLANAATSNNTVDTIVRRDASGNFAAGVITADLVGNATSATASTTFTGVLSGDVTGAQNATVVETVGGQTAANIASGVSLANAATSSNTANTIVRRNASGGFTAGTITGTLIGNASTATIANSVVGQTSSNTPSRVVVRDASGNFAAGTITANLAGNATTATTSTNFSGSLAGDVTGTQSTTVVETVGGQNAANIASATTLVNAATDSNTANALVRRDASGNFAAGVITADLVGNASTAATATNFSGSLSGDVTGMQNLTVVSTVGGQTAASIASGANLANAATDSNTANTIVRRDVSGNFSAGTITANLVGSASTATTATNFTGSLAGDITGTQNATVVSTVGGQSAASVASGTTLANAATSANTANALVRRDASGNFSAGTITANLTGAASQNVLKAGDTMSGTLTLEPDAGSALIALGNFGVPTLVITPEGSSVGISIDTTTANALQIGTNRFTVNGTTGNTFIAGSTTLGALGAGVVHSDATGTLSSSPIVNADIAPAASIDYSKLNLTNAIVNADISSTAAITDDKLAQITTAGKVANSATTATDTNTPNTIVLRDASGNFSANVITADLIGNVSGTASLNVLTAGDSTINGSLLLDGPSSSLTVEGLSTFADTLFSEGVPGITQNTLQVTKGAISGPNQFNSIKVAVDSITDNTATNRYVVSVGPGVYIEDTITLKPFVSLVGQSRFECIIEVDDPAKDVIIGAPSSSLTHFTLRGATGVDQAAIVYNGGNGVFSVANCIFGNNYILVNQFGSVQPWCSMNMQNCDIEGTSNFATGIQISGTGTVLSINVINNFNLQARTNIPSLQQVFNISGPLSYLIGSTMSLVSIIGPLAGNAFDVSNGASVSLSSINTVFFNTAFNVINAGTGSVLNIFGFFALNCTNDLIVANPFTTGSFVGTIERSKTSIDPEAELTLLLTDPADQSTTIAGSLFLGDEISNITNVSPSIQYSTNLGVITGGELSALSGLDLQVAAGTGYLMVTIPTDNDLKYVEWPAQTITLPANSYQFIFINNSGVLSISAGQPDPTTTIILGRVQTTATDILYIQRTQREADHTSTLLDVSLRESLGNVYVSGSVVSQNAGNPLQLDVTQGRYFYSTHEFLPTGGIAVSWTGYYRAAITGFNTTPLTNTIDDLYDDGSGTLASIPVGQFARHAFYIIAEGNPDGSDAYLLVYSQQLYDTLIEAQNGVLPNPPSTFIGNTVRIASIIVESTVGGPVIASITQEHPRLGTQATSITGVTRHGDLTGLLEDDHPQYLLVNGTRAMAGNLNLGTNNITNVGTVNTVVVENHASRHLPNGQDPLATATPVSIGTTNSIGIANSFARSDHQHAHGNLPGGTLHALATTSIAGFMSGVDKMKLDALDPANFVQRTGDTMTGTLTLNPTTGLALNALGVAGSPTISVTPEAASGGVVIGATTGNALAIDTDKFTVQGTTGNTTIAGTFTLAGTSTLSTLGTGVVHAGATGTLSSSLIVNSDITDATITDSKLASPVTSTNTANAIVKRDASGNFAAGTITADLAGNASTATTATSFSGALAGDVTGTQNATVVSFVGGQPASSIVSGAVLANSATSVNTPNTLVRRNASGNFSAGTITANLIGSVTGASSLNVLKAGDTMTGTLTLAPTVGTALQATGAAGSPTVVIDPEATSAGLVIGSTSGNALAINVNRFTVNGTTGDTLIGGVTTIASLGAGVVHADATGVLTSSSIVNNDIANATIADNKLASPVTSANVANSLVKRDGAGDFAAGTITANLIGNATSSSTTMNFTGSLAGDVTGTQTTTVVNSVGGQTAANIANATVLANAATSTNTANTIVRRDAVGDFSAGTITASLTGAASLNVLKAGDTMTGTLNLTPTAGNALTATGTSGFATLALVPEATSRGITIGTTTGNALEINTNRFTVQGSTGNTTIAGTLGVSGVTTLSSLGAGIVHANSGGVLSSSQIVNSDISPTAAIAYSKLNLANSITDSDISPTAAIADTKLATLVTVGKVANSATTATSANTANTIVLRDASGNFSAGTITANLVGNASTATSTTNFSGSLAGDVTGTQNATVVSTVGGQSAANVASGTVLANAATSANTPNTIVRRDASGNFSAGTITADLTGNASTATTATNFSGSLAGDVTGTQNATVVSTVGGQSAANVASGTTLANAATSANTPNTIVRRDASGNFSAGTITASLTGAASLNVLKAGDTMTGTLTLSPTIGTGLLVNGTAGSAAITVTPQATSRGITIGTTTGNALEINTNRFTVQGSTGNTTIAGTLITAGATTLSTLGIGVVHANSAGLLSSSLIVNNDIANATITDSKLASPVTSTNTANALVKRDASGNFAAGTITADLAGNASTATTATNFSGALAGDVTGTQATTIVSSVGGQSAANVASGTVLANAATSANTANAIVRRDASGNFSAGTITANLTGNASTATTAANFSGSLAGDVTGTQNATVVSTVGGQSAANVASATTLANAATSANMPNTLVRRDASGNFSAGTITASLTGAASLNVLKAGDTMTGTLSIIPTTGSAIIATGNASSPAATITAGANQPALTVSDGTVAIPSIAFNSQNNMGLYRIGTNSLGISTAGVNRMIIDTDGARYTSNFRLNAYLAANGNLGTASIIIPFSAENFDPGLDYNPVNGLYTVPVTGVYFVSTAVSVLSNLTAIKSLELVRNGAAVAGYSASQTIPNAERANLNICGLISLTAGDTLGVRYNGRVGETLIASDTYFNVHLMSI